MSSICFFRFFFHFFWEQCRRSSMTRVFENTRLSADVTCSLCETAHDLSFLRAQSRDFKDVEINFWRSWFFYVRRKRQDQSRPRCRDEEWLLADDIRAGSRNRAAELETTGEYSRIKHSYWNIAKIYVSYTLIEILFNIARGINLPYL